MQLTNNGKLSFDYTDAADKTQRIDLDLITLKIECESVESMFPQCRRGDVFVPNGDFLAALAESFQRKLKFEPITNTTAFLIWQQAYEQMLSLKKNTNETPN
jgi:hypothetical protein